MRLILLTAASLSLFMAANASPAEIRQFKLWVAGLSLPGACGVALAIFLIRTGQPGGAAGGAAGAAFAPTAIIGIVTMVSR